jgi:hypothetical protein
MTLKLISRSGCLAAFALVPFLVGCGGVRPAKVTGILTLNGQPVEGATVQFVPVKEGGRPATGLTKADGGFSLTTFEDQDGALPGEYKVVITYHPPVENAPPAQTTEQGMKQAMQAQAQAKKGKPKYVIPAAYSDASKTPFTQTVPTNGPIKFDIK